MKPMSVSRQRQSGLTLISWMVIFAIIALLAMTVLKLFPVYMEHLNVTSSLNSLSSDTELRGAGPGELRETLVKRLDINDVKRVTRDNITIVRDGQMYSVNITYEVVVPFAYNVSFLINFDDTAEVSAQ